MGKSKIISVERVSSDEWVQQLEKFNYGLFNTREWVESTLTRQDKSIFLNFFVDDEVVGKIAGLITTIGRFKGHSLYFTSGPALRDNNEAKYAACLVALRKYAQRNGYLRIHIVAFEQQITTPVNVNGFFRTKSVEFVINYEKGQTEINVSKDVQRRVVKNEKAGYLFYRTQSVDLLPKLFKLLKVTHETRVYKYGVEYDPLSVYDLSQESLTRLIESGLGVLSYIEADNEVHSASMTLEKDGKVYGLLLGGDQVAYSKGLIVYLCHQIAMHNLQNNGCYTNLGDLPSEEEGSAGLKRFKLSLGSEAVKRYGYHTYYLQSPYYFLNPLIKINKRLSGKLLLRPLWRLSQLFIRK